LKPCYVTLSKLPSYQFSPQFSQKLRFVDFGPRTSSALPMTDLVSEDRWAH
jgi:hypothetical protein